MLYRDENLRLPSNTISVYKASNLYVQLLQYGDSSFMNNDDDSEKDYCKSVLLENHFSSLVNDKIFF